MKTTLADVFLISLKSKQNPVLPVTNTERLENQFKRFKTQRHAECLKRGTQQSTKTADRNILLLHLNRFSLFIITPCVTVRIRVITS